MVPPQPTPKPSNRSIRRAFGPEAVALLETQTKQVASIASAFVHMEQDVVPVLDAYRQFQGLGFLGRLRLLLFGR